LSLEDSKFSWLHGRVSPSTLCANTSGRSGGSVAEHAEKSRQAMHNANNLGVITFKPFKGIQ